MRAELATLVDDLSSLINALWPHLEDPKYRWELHSYGLPEGYDKLIVADIIGLLIEALKGIGATDNKLIQAHTKADRASESCRRATFLGPFGESPILSPLGFRVGLFVPDSVDLAGGVGVPARRSVLGWGSVAQGRVSVPLVVAGGQQQPFLTSLVESLQQ